MGKKVDWAIGGGAIGWLLGGPIGGAIGGFLGYMLSPETAEVKCPYCGAELEIEPDKGVLWECPKCGNSFIYDPVYSSKAIRAGDEDYSGYILFSTFSFLCGFTAKLDGQISYTEKEAFRELLEEVGLDLQNIDYLSSLFDSDITQKEDPDNFWENVLFPRMPAAFSYKSEEEIFSFLYMLLGSLFYIANSSPPIHPKQELFILDIAKSLGMDESLVWEIKNDVLNPSEEDNNNKLEEAYKLLGLAYDADCNAIKSAYHRNVRDIHPDKYSDLPEPVKRVLNEKMQKLNDAYELLIKHKNCH